jgi:hypothetical protein
VQGPGVELGNLGGTRPLVQRAHAGAVFRAGGKRRICQKQGRSATGKAPKGPRVQAEQPKKDALTSPFSASRVAIRQHQHRSAFSELSKGGAKWVGGR